MGKPTMWFPNRFDTNRAVQSHKIPRGWKFWIQKVEELYYPCSENKGADQLRGYREADHRLCFRYTVVIGFLTVVIGFLTRWLLGRWDTVSLFFMEIKWLKLRNRNSFP